MKIYFIVLDGAADRPIPILDSKTPLEYAATPNLDRLASWGENSYIKILPGQLIPESDSGAMALLGYNPLEYYCGRGALESLGLGIPAQHKNVASFRINFASYDKEKKLLERRTARNLSDKELQQLAESLRKNIKISMPFHMHVFGKYRGIFSFYSEHTELSGNVTNTDPGFKKCGCFGIPVNNYSPVPPRCVPLDETISAYNTAQAVNEFSRQAYAILENHEINKTRRNNGKLPANYILFRDGGSRCRPLPNFTALNHKTLILYGQLPAEQGLASLIGADFSYTQAFELQLDTKYLTKMVHIMKKDGHDISFIHLKGPDEPGHDKNPLRKVKAIELIDSYFFDELNKIKKDDDIVIVTCDHATPCEAGIHTNDKVPILFSGRYWKRNPGNRFTEAKSINGSCQIQSADEILNYLNRHMGRH